MFSYSYGHHAGFRSREVRTHARRRDSVHTALPWGCLHFFVEKFYVHCHCQDVLLTYVYVDSADGTKARQRGVQSGVRIQAQPRYFSLPPTVPTGSVAQAASCSVRIRRSFPRGQKGRGVRLTTRHHLMPSTPAICLHVKHSDGFYFSLPLSLFFCFDELGKFFSAADCSLCLTASPTTFPLSYYWLVN